MENFTALCFGYFVTLVMLGSLALLFSIVAVQHANRCFAAGEISMQILYEARQGALFVFFIHLRIAVLLTAVVTTGMLYFRYSMNIPHVWLFLVGLWANTWVERVLLQSFLVSATACEHCVRGEEHDHTQDENSPE